MKCGKKPAPSGLHITGLVGAINLGRWMSKLNIGRSNALSPTSESATRVYLGSFHARLAGWH